MSLHRFFVTGSLPDPHTPDWPAPLSPGDLRHLERVLRVSAGDRIVLVDASGREAECAVREARLGSLLVDVGEVVVRPARPYVALAQGLSRRERMEFVMQRATELGVAEIGPVAFVRSVVQWKDERAGGKLERWRRIAAEAAKQSQRSDVPVIRDVMDLEGLTMWAGGFDIVLVPWEECVGSPEHVPGVGEALDEARANSSSRVLVIIGPEGGLESAEVQALQQGCDARVVSLGDTVLRTETAGAIAVALVSYELGGLGGQGRG